MEFLKAIALSLALITGFSVYGPTQPVELFTTYEPSEVTHIPSSLRPTDRLPVKPAITEEQVLKNIAASKQLAEDDKADKNAKTGTTPSEKATETKASKSNKSTGEAKQEAKNTESAKKTESKNKENKTSEETKKTSQSDKTSESTKKSSEETKKPDTSTSSKTAYFDVPLKKDLQDYIFKVCESYNVDPSIIVAMIWQESSYRVTVIGDNGNAYGLMQIQPRWHKDRMKRLGVDDLLDPYQNVLVGIDYFAELYHKKDSYTWALMAYNGGASYANKKTKAGEVSKYAKEVLQKQKELTK